MGQTKERREGCGRSQLSAPALGWAAGGHRGGALNLRWPEEGWLEALGFALYSTVFVEPREVK